MTEDAPEMIDETPLPKRRANRKVTLVYRLEYALARGLFAFFRLVGLDRASAIAGGFLRIVGPLLRPLSRRGEDNLRATFPDWDEARIHRVMAGVWENLGRIGAEFAHLEKLVPFTPGSRVEVIGAERLFAIANGEGPVIFVSGHFANWELMPIAIQAAGIDHAIIYRPSNNPLIDELIIAERAKVMARFQIPKGRRGGRALIEALSAGKSIALLVDQKLNSGVAAPFLGREAMTAPAAARLSLRFGAPIVPMSIERLKGARFRITVRAPIVLARRSDASTDIRALLVLVNQSLERDVRAHPEQWLWLHRRWPKAPVSSRPR